MTDNDKAEIATFRRYLGECAAWDKANDDLPDFAPVSDIERVTYYKKRLKAHAAIYETIYHEKVD